MPAGACLVAQIAACFCCSAGTRPPRARAKGAIAPTDKHHKGNGTVSDSR
jgi:hypothetical protein